MANILIFRFSAIGDVAMTVPVIDSLARQYPNDHFTLVSQHFLAPVFAHCPSNVRFFGVDLKNEYKGAAGMFRLYKKLSTRRFDGVADLHDVLRTKLLRFFFACNGVTVKCIAKGRKEKKQLTRKKNKIYRQLSHSTERYANVFRALNRPVQIDFRSIFGLSRGDFRKIEFFTGAKTGKWMGIAPFAKHRGKIYPTERTEEIVACFSANSDTTIFLFGGKEEKVLLEQWGRKYGCMVPAGKLSLTEELILISHLDLMYSMDSANMHLASIVAVPVVSVWGATHPFAGFYGYNQPEKFAVQTDLFCRPCSVYGNKPCYRKNMACLTEILPQEIIDRMRSIME